MAAFHLEEFWFTLLHKNDFQGLWHTEIEIIFLLQGTGRVYFPDLKTTYPLREKDIFVINSFEVCDFELEEEAIALSFSVSQGFANSIAPELLKYRINCRSFLYMEDKQAAFDVLRQDLAKAFKELSKNEKQGVSCSKSSATAILEDLKHYFLENEQNLERGGIGETLKSVTNYIQNHYLERITLEDLAEHTFLSKTYISRIFTHYFGISFTGYLELLRLSHATRLLAGKGTLSEVAENSGFPNINAMIQAFKRYRNMTPGEYRRNLDENRGEMAVEPKPFEEGNELFKSLLCFAEIPSAELPNAEQVLEVMVDAACRKEHISTHWKRLLNVGYARSLTDGRIQRELRYMQEKIGFEYLRIKGILDDDMCLLRMDMNGNTVMNYAYVDEGIDFILSVGAKPMIEMGFMPGMLAKNAQIRSMRGQIVSNPKDIESWQTLISSLVTHLVKRYGEKRVEKWLFSPWVAPDFIDLGLESKEEYSKAYVASYRAIRSVVPHALIVGPGCVSFSNYWAWYLEMCKIHGCMPDIISFRSFAAVGEREEDGMKLIGNNESFPYAVSADENFLAHTAEEIRGILKEDGLDGMPLIVEEWSNNIWQRDLCNDTCYKSAYLFKNILENNHRINAMGYFALNDRLDEVPPTAETFHGGFGLFTQNDIPKSACRAMELLSYMGNRLLSRGEGYFVSQTDEEIQIYLYNYSHYDLLYRYRHVVNMNQTNREQVFVSRDSRAFFVRIKNLPEGVYQIYRYGITREGGSSYDAWVRMGAPSALDVEEQEMLRCCSGPEYHRKQVQTTNGELHIKASLSPHDVWLIRIKRA